VKLFAQAADVLARLGQGSRIWGNAMSYTLQIDEQLQADEQLVNHLKMKNYEFILKFFNTSYGFNFCTDRSGAVFESCVDFCAQNAGNVDDAKQVLLRLFETFYEGLPPPVQEDLAYLGDEVGYDPTQTNRQLKLVWSGKLSMTVALTSMLRKVQELMMQARSKRFSLRRPHPQSPEPFQISVPASMMMQEEKFVLDISREAALSRSKHADRRPAGSPLRCPSNRSAGTGFHGGP
jgi:hypothetical protein